MTAGLSSANAANAWLNVFRGGGNGVTFTAPATLFVELHTADPGASGTTAVANASTRNALTLNAASAGAITLTALAAFTGTITETITHIAVFSASSAGTFYWSCALTTSKTINVGDTLTFTAVGISLSPIAA